MSKRNSLLKNLRKRTKRRRKEVKLAPPPEGKRWKMVSEVDGDWWDVPPAPKESK